MGKRRATEALVSDQAAKDYAKHMEKLLEEYGDVVEQPDKRGPSPPVPSSFTLTPGPSSTPAAGNSTGDGGNTADMFSGPAGSATGGSTGRKSVTFAASAAFGTPAGAAAASSGGFGTPLFGTPRLDGATPGAPANTTHAGAAAGSTVAGFGAGLGSAPQVAPAPGAAAPVAANGGAGGGDGEGAAADEGRNVYNPEIQVDESIWNVYFKKKAKLHIKVENADGTNGWSELGLGLLTVRQKKEGPNSRHCYILFSTDGVRDD
eukprot:gene5644-5883_t